MQGFYDRDSNCRALQATGGNVNAVRTRLMDVRSAASAGAAAASAPVAVFRSCDGCQELVPVAMCGLPRILESAGGVTVDPMLRAQAVERLLNS